MPTKPNPTNFNRLVRDTCLSSTLPKSLGEMQGRNVVPIHDKLGQVPTDNSCLKTQEGAHAIEDLSNATNYLGDGLDSLKHTTNKTEGTSLTLLTSATSMLSGVAGVIDNVKKVKRAEVIGDSTGKKLAVVGCVENGMLAGGSGVELALKSIDIGQDIAVVAHKPFVIAGAAAVAQGALSWLSTALFGIYYIATGAKHLVNLVQLYKGRQWRMELAKEKDPMEALYKEFRRRSYEVDMTPEQEIDLALEAGARWLEKVEGASEGKLSIEDKKEGFRKLVMDRPEIITKMIGPYSRKLTPRGELIRFGKYMAYKNLHAKFEAECKRKLGEKALEAMQSGNTEELKAALEVKPWFGLSIKVAAAAIGLIAVVAMAVFITGSPLGIVLLLAGLAAVAMIFLGDGKALIEHLRNGEFKKRDRAFTYLSIALSVISVAAAVGMLIATGGTVAFIAPLILSVVWMGINLHTARTIWRFDNRKWEVQKVIDLKTYRQFLETNPKDVEKIKAKLSEEDQNYVNGLQNPLEELRAREKRIEEETRRQLDELVDRIAVESKQWKRVKSPHGERNQRFPGLPRVREGFKSSHA